jgi:hypothetical protein
MLMPQSVMSSPARDTQPVLHNSGQGPSAVYRTAPVGTVHVLRLFEELHRCPRLPEAVRAPFDLSRHLAPRDRAGAAAPRYTHSVVLPADVEPVVHAVLSLLPEAETQASPHHVESAGRAADEWGALTAIGMLTQRLQQLGALVVAPMLVTWVPDAPSGSAPPSAAGTGDLLPWLKALDVAHPDHAELLRLAWITCAVSHTAPPLVFFRRTPSLRYWRGDGALSVRWLGHAEVRP